MTTDMSVAAILAYCRPVQVNCFKVFVMVPKAIRKISVLWFCLRSRNRKNGPSNKNNNLRSHLISKSKSKQKVRSDFRSEKNNSIITDLGDFNWFDEMIIKFMVFVLFKNV